jgi:thiamine-monophosphate kinase
MSHSPTRLSGSVQTVAELGERAAIERIRARVPPPPPWTVLGIGDDAAVAEPERNTLDVLTCDALIEQVHFDRAFVPPSAIGFKALAVNLSDLAAMGATPRLALLSLALPSGLLVSELDDLVSGMLEAAGRHRVALVGGNIARSPGPLMVDVTAVGAVRRRRFLGRSGARPGDAVYVSGEVGAALAGFESLRAAASGAGGADLREPSSDAGPATGMAACERRFLTPEPRVRLGQLLGRNRVASACIDLSDGLADGLRQLASASGVGLFIDAHTVPIAGGARRWFARLGADPEIAAISGGEDYELLFTIPPRRQRAFDRIRSLAGDLPCTRIGRVTSGAELTLMREGGAEALPPGFAHFR